MRDGQTRRMGAVEQDSVGTFLARHQVKLVVLSGPSAGRELAITTGCLTIGRGPGVDGAFEDDAMSRQHAAFEFGPEGFRVRDLQSTNGVVLNGQRVETAELRHGDRLEIGNLSFQLVIDAREEEPDTYELPAEV